MSFILCRRLSQNTIQRNGGCYACFHQYPRQRGRDQKQEFESEDEFRVLHVRPRASRGTQFREKGGKWSNIVHTGAGPRVNRMDPDNFDWPSIWPGPRSFQPHSIPLPIRQGQYKRSILLSKYANPELMKIPNFFHLTPPAVKAHCEAIKKFCSPFPKALDTTDKCDEHFPVTVTTHDYLHSSPSIRDPAARVVSMKLKLKSLPLDEHARDKFLRLVGPRHDCKTDTVTIVTDRCPTRKQNYDYAQYLFTALFFESWKTEAWESEKSEQDMEKYVWENSASAKKLASIVHWTPGKEEVEPLTDLLPVHVEYREKVSMVKEEESEENIAKYGQATKQLLLKTSNS